ncbi:Aryl hydrocarbon receptor [Strongyloides ratti]|uniref:Aryl hydrocarbon receptor n=1 Tax=Strongyloides ratti TaxID=34506 RepID=A0A090MX17_STRRB|nr:Aryl hydrocarbon receptor [Strongyloides ratti]CEF64654.1 Aryl hydrocarbon receptor [Strongyloides ratti]
MYANKRRQRNFKRIRENVKPSTASNPSKRHRERLNGELETIANLLPYEQGIITRLDKLSVLRLAVSYLQIKAHFQASFIHPTITGSEWLRYINLWNPRQPMGPIPTITDINNFTPLYDPKESSFDILSAKALGGFIIILNDKGEINYASENIDQFLGFHQSDILHQPIFDMIHSEDRDDIKAQLNVFFKYTGTISTPFDLIHLENGKHLERNVSARFRCLLDNTCGFVRVDIKGKLIPILGPQMQILNAHITSELLSQNKFGLAAICCPFVPPLHIDEHLEDPILKTKHTLDFNIISMDSRMKNILELDDHFTSPKSFYSFCHPEDATCLAEAHKEVIKSSAAGILIYRLIGQKTGSIYWFQSSCRIFYKNGKPETIGLTHRMLTEVEGVNLLDKKINLKTKLLSFDESLLQSPRNLQSAAALPKMTKISTSNNESNKKNTKENISRRIVDNNNFQLSTFYQTPRIDIVPQNSISSPYPIQVPYISTPSSTGPNNYYSPVQYPVSMSTSNNIYQDYSLYNTTTAAAVHSLFPTDFQYPLSNTWTPTTTLEGCSMDSYNFQGPQTTYNQNQLWSPTITTSYNNMPTNFDSTINYLKESNVDKFHNTFDINTNGIMVNSRRQSNTNSLASLSFISELSNTLLT